MQLKTINNNEKTICCKARKMLKSVKQICNENVFTKL